MGFRGQKWLKLSSNRHDTGSFSALDEPLLEATDGRQVVAGMALFLTRGGLAFSFDREATPTYDQADIALYSPMAQSGNFRAPIERVPSFAVEAMLPFVSRQGDRGAER